MTTLPAEAPAQPDAVRLGPAPTTRTQHIAPGPQLFPGLPDIGPEIDVFWDLLSMPGHEVDAPWMNPAATTA